MAHGPDRSVIAEHLKLFSEIGVDGVSRDVRWRERREGQGPMAKGQSEDSGEALGPEESVPSLALGPGPVADSGAGLSALRHHIGDCTRCKLHAQGRKQVVFGSGDANADLMFVGEAPGADEDVQGVPFVGRAGQLLTKIIEAIGLTREQVYIANVIKCRPPENRNPEPDEVDTCEPFLFQQIDTIKPKVIVALGTFAARALLRTLDPISRLRGRVYDYRGAKLIPTFHPAYLLRNPSSKREVWADMKLARELLK
jgi:uracil-DNA glycosylase family 4